MFALGMIPALFPVIVIIVIGVVAVMAIRGVTQWSHNNTQPRIPAEARVVAKRADVSNHLPSRAGDNSPVHFSSNTSYFVTFEFLSGDRQELHVPPQEYGMIAEGDSGILTAQGTRFISFERRQ
jgi:ABC-type phosphate transport system auxiliary subunit